MPTLNFRLPDAERSIIWRYLDGVSQALARRFDGGSSPGEENLTFLLCELLDEGTTGLHLLEYPLKQAKDDLARADGGVSLDVSFQTHEHTKHVEHHFSGADLGVIFIVDHPYFGHSEKAVLLQAKRLFPASTGEFSLNSSFSSFHPDQRDLLMEVGRRFSAEDSIFYLWYAPSSRAFSEDEAKLIRSLEAMNSPNWLDLRGWHPFLDELIEFRGLWREGLRPPVPAAPPDEEREQSWRLAQPATRISSLSIVNDLTTSGHGPRLAALYQARSSWHKQRRPWRWLVFEPLAELFLLALQWGRIGDSSPQWLRLARGEKIPMPPLDTADAEEAPDVPQIVPVPRHSITFTLRSSLRWPDGFYRAD